MKKPSRNDPTRVPAIRVVMSAPPRCPAARPRSSTTQPSSGVQIARFGAYNPFNDVFTYLVHAQWLQGHGFGDSVAPSGLHPAETQVLLFQKQGLRMGASFLFGWLQGVFGSSWTYLLYPVAILLPLAAGALCIGGGAAHIARAGPAMGWGTGLAVALTFNGFAHGANNGFLPQTYGLLLCRCRSPAARSLARPDRAAYSS